MGGVKLNMVFMKSKFVYWIYIKFKNLWQRYNKYLICANFYEKILKKAELVRLLLAFFC